MLFGVEYKSIEIERLQNALSYFFSQLGNGNITFDENLFPLAFRPYLFVKKNPANGYKVFVRKYFEPILNSFVALNANEKAFVISSFIESNKIDEICLNAANPVLFADLPVTFQAPIRGLLNLYDELSDIIQREADVDAFRIVNGSICSTCGSYTVSHLDHYLPKGKDNPLYIFSAVNPKNLICSCTACNQGKSSKLIIFDNNRIDGVRVKTFHPYENVQTWKYLNIKLKCISEPTVSNSGEWVVSISFNRKLNNTLSNKIKRWKTFYDIENRFARELRLNINVWLKTFELAKNEKNETLQGYITTIMPSQLSIIQIPNIILQSRFFLYLHENKKIREKYLSPKVTTRNPMDLLNTIGVV